MAAALDPDPVAEKLGAENDGANFGFFPGRSDQKGVLSGGIGPPGILRSVIQERCVCRRVGSVNPFEKFVVAGRLIVDALEKCPVFGLATKCGP